MNYQQNDEPFFLNFFFEAVPIINSPKNYLQMFVGPKKLDLKSKPSN